MHDISNNRAPSKISESFVCSNMIHSHYIPHFLPQVIFMSRGRDFNQLLLSFSRSQVYEFGTKFLLRYVNSAKTLSSVNYINYWSRFWRPRRWMLIWVPLPVPTWTPYSVKVFSFLISIGATFHLFMYIYYLFHFIFAFSLLTFFCRLNWRQLLYCCPPRIARLIVGNIDLNYLTTEFYCCCCFCCWWWSGVMSTTDQGTNFPLTLYIYHFKK